MIIIIIIIIIIVIIMIITIITFIYLTSIIYNYAVNQNKIIWSVDCSLHKSNNCPELVTKLQISAFNCEVFHSV